MLVFISDIHSRAGGRTNVPRVEQLKRFWQRLETARRADLVTLCFVGDTFDLVRDPSWFSTSHRPYHAMTPQLQAQVETLVRATLEAEKDFFALIKAQVTSGALDVELITRFPLEIRKQLDLQHPYLDEEFLDPLGRELAWWQGAVLPR